MKLAKLSYCLLPILLALSLEVSPASTEQRLFYSVAQLSVGDEEKTNVSVMLAEMVKEIGGTKGHGEYDYGVFPFPRSLSNLAFARADIHLPVVVNKAGAAELAKRGYAYIPEPFGEVSFSIAYRKGDLKMQAWREANFAEQQQGDLSLISDSSQEWFFSYFSNIEFSSCRACALEMVARGRVGGFLFATLELDILVSNSDYDNIVIEPLDTFPMSMIYRMDNTKNVEQRVTRALRDLKQDGRIKAITKKFIDFHQQPKGPLMNSSLSN
ncbi:MAG: transporter substrate-binding domain-containing protein [Cellvibrionaceae bacterium]|nr:transporter substrate-binding domain-containing protein [Cellvibrionaceae bacterium]